MLPEQGVNGSACVNVVIAILVGTGAGGDVGFGIHHADLGSNDHGAGRIGDAAQNPAAEFLGGSPGAQQQQSCE